MAMSCLKTFLREIGWILDKCPHADAILTTLRILKLLQNNFDLMGNYKGPSFKGALGKILQLLFECNL